MRGTTRSTIRCRSAAALGLLALTCSGAASHAAEFPGPTVRIVSVDGEDAEHAPLSIDRAHVAAGVGVEVVKWPPDGRGELWIRARSLDVRADVCYGPARRSGHDTWRISDVRLGDGQHERRELELQAFLSAAPATDDPGCERRVASAGATSAPVRLTVARRDPAEQDGRVRITTLDRNTPVPDEPSVVGPSAEVAGTLAEGAAGLIYLLVGARGGPIWEVLGPAERSGTSWTLREARLGTTGGDDQERALVAVLAKRRLHGRRLTYEAWRSQVLAASPTVRIIVRGAGPSASLTIESVAVDGQTERVGALGAAVELGALARLDRLEGTCAPGSDPIWIVTSSARAEVVRLHGPAVRQGSHWSFGGPSLRDPGHLEGDTLFAYAIATPLVPGEGLALADRARALAHAESSGVTLHLSPPLPHLEAPPLDLTRIGGSDVRDGTAVVATGNTEISGTIGSLSAHRRPFLRAAIRLDEGGDWALSPVLTPGAEQWNLSDFPALELLDRDRAAPVVVVATDYPLLADVLDARELASLPLATSPAVLVGRDQSRLARMTGYAVTPARALWFAALVSLFGLIAWFLVRRPPMTTSLLSPFSKSLAAADARLRDTLAPLLRTDGRSRLFEGQPASVDQALGLLILGALALAIGFYVPLYQKVIGVVLDAPSISRNLSVALITFAALAGVLLEAAPKLLSPTAGARLTARILQRALACGAGVVTAVCTVALCAVNTLIYAAYYQRQAPAVVLAFGGAALLMSTLEVVGFFVGLHLGFGLVVWLFAGLFVRLPLTILRGAVALLASRGGSAQGAHLDGKNDGHGDPTAPAPTTYAASPRNGSPGHRRPELARLDRNEQEEE